MSSLANAHVTGRSVGAHVIWTAFAGNIGADACDTAFALAQKHRSGFCDVSKRA